MFLVLGSSKNVKTGSDKYLAGIIVLVILLLISFFIIAYLIYKKRQVKSQNTEDKQETRNESNPRPNIYDSPVNNYEQTENDQPTYMALKKPGEREDDGHVYGHLSQVPHIYANREETGI